ncbi:putative norrin [Triplophysa rosa]|uniref:Norrin n=1 Tax=Triplophysa rosa TaxID=992332 RepID=A0A9W8C6M7_TRIRA|nr:putative norrin [Triplophysa rosa]
MREKEIERQLLLKKPHLCPGRGSWDWILWVKRHHTKDRSGKTAHKGMADFKEKAYCTFRFTYAVSKVQWRPLRCLQ